LRALGISCQSSASGGAARLDLGVVHGGRANGSNGLCLLVDHLWVKGLLQKGGTQNCRSHNMEYLVLLRPEYYLYERAKERCESMVQWQTPTRMGRLYVRCIARLGAGAVSYHRGTYE
jgi:hypothetical protein